MAVIGRLHYKIDEQKIRDLLGEHAALFPDFRVAAPEDGLWEGRPQTTQGLCRSTIGAGNRLIDCTIFLKGDAFLTKQRLRTIIMHELRHWWQTANHQRWLKTSRRWWWVLLLSLISVMSIIAALCWFDRGSTDGWYRLVLFGWLVFEFSCWYTPWFSLAAEGRLKEVDAYSFCYSLINKILWRGAIKIEER